MNINITQECELQQASANTISSIIKNKTRIKHLIDLIRRFILYIKCMNSQLPGTFSERSLVIKLAIFMDQVTLT